MSDIKFGSSSIGEPAPKGWRQFERAFIIGVVPALIVFVQSWGFTTATSNKLLIVIALIASLIKSTGMFLSDGDSYVPTDTLTTQQKIIKADEKK